MAVEKHIERIFENQGTEDLVENAFQRLRKASSEADNGRMAAVNIWRHPSDAKLLTETWHFGEVNTDSVEKDEPCHEELPKSLYKPRYKTHGKIFQDIPGKKPRPWPSFDQQGFNALTGKRLHSRSLYDRNELDLGSYSWMQALLPPMSLVLDQYGKLKVAVGHVGPSIAFLAVKQEYLGPDTFYAWAEPLEYEDYVTYDSITCVQNETAAYRVLQWEPVAPVDVLLANKNRNVAGIDAIFGRRVGPPTSILRNAALHGFYDLTGSQVANVIKLLKGTVLDGADDDGLLVAGLFNALDECTPPLVISCLEKKTEFEDRHSNGAVFEDIFCSVEVEDLVDQSDYAEAKAHATEIGHRREARDRRRREIRRKIKELADVLQGGGDAERRSQEHKKPPLVAGAWTHEQVRAWMPTLGDLRIHKVSSDSSWAVFWRRPDLGEGPGPWQKRMANWRTSELYAVKTLARWAWDLVRPLGEECPFPDLLVD